MKPIQAGAGKARIRIPEEVFPQEQYTKEESPIHVRVLLLDDGERTGLVSLEMPSVRDPRDMEALKKCAAAGLACEEKSLWICTTHDLCTMHIPARQEEPEKHDLFLDSLLMALKKACAQAVRTRSPAKIGIGTGTCDINTSRDIRTNQGWWNGLGGESEEDKQLTVFRFEREDGTPIALMYHYPVKCCTVQNAFYEDGTRVSSSELAGESSRIIEEAFGAPAIFLMGAAADMVPKETALYSIADENGDLREIDLGVEEGLKRKNFYGKKLADCVLRTAAGITCRKDVRLAGCQVTYSYPGQQFYNEGRPYHPTPDYVYVPAGEEELEVTALAIGDVLLLGLQPETTAVTGLQLRRKYAPVRPLLVSLVNGGKDYMADELSYERRTMSATHSVFAEGSAEKFVEDAADIIRAVYQEGETGIE